MDNSIQFSNRRVSCEMQVGYGSSLVAQYSSSCSPFEEDVSYHASNDEDDFMGILSSDLLVSQTAGHQLEV